MPLIGILWGQDDKQCLLMRSFLGAGQLPLVEEINLMVAKPKSLSQPQIPVRYYLQLRLQKAQQLLAQTNLPLLDIGIACGFSGKAYFIKCYREYFGVTPSEGRKQARLLSGENQNPVSSGLRH